MQQLDIDWQPPANDPAAPATSFSEDRATLLFIIDSYNKHLFDTDTQPVRKVRETLDDFAKAIVKTPDAEIEKVFFKFRQFFSTHRLEESSYVQKTFEEFKTIIWEFADQLGDDVADEKIKEGEINSSLGELREAVESNSIEILRTKAREFIDVYVKTQHHREDKKSKRLVRVKKNLQTIKKKLVEANTSMTQDHLTKAYNRKSFDEQIKNYHKLAEISKSPISLMIMDIDFFKKINDSYGHDIGDFVLKECVKLLQEVFCRPEDFVARIGGEEFAVLLPELSIEAAVKKAEEVMAKVRREVFIQDKLEIRFTMSMGIAQLKPEETPLQWIKRADQALYQSKNSGRNKYTLAGDLVKIESVA